MNSPFPTNPATALINDRLDLLIRALPGLPRAELLDGLYQVAARLTVPDGPGLDAPAANRMQLLLIPLAREQLDIGCTPLRLAHALVERACLLGGPRPSLPPLDD